MAIAYLATAQPTNNAPGGPHLRYWIYCYAGRSLPAYTAAYKTQHTDYQNNWNFFVVKNVPICSKLPPLVLHVTKTLIQQIFLRRILTMRTSYAKFELSFTKNKKPKNHLNNSTIHDRSVAHWRRTYPRERIKTGRKHGSTTHLERNTMGRTLAIHAPFLVPTINKLRCRSSAFTGVEHRNKYLCAELILVRVHTL